jgi:hypothetical protein
MPNFNKIRKTVNGMQRNAHLGTYISSLYYVTEKRSSFMWFGESPINHISSKTRTGLVKYIKASMYNLRLYIRIYYMNVHWKITQHVHTQFYCLQQPQYPNSQYNNLKLPVVTKGYLLLTLYYHTEKCSNTNLLINSVKQTPFWEAGSSSTSS